MYAFPAMLELTEQEWPSEAHKVVAERVLIGNSRYHSLTDLKEGASIIAAIPEDKIKLVTAMDLYALGVMLP
jgi:hypothetical protein